MTVFDYTVDEGMCRTAVTASNHISSLPPAGMDERSEPLRLDRNCVVVQSAPRAGRIPSHLISTLPYLQDIPRDLCINAQRSLLRSYCVLRWLRGELDDEQATIVEERLGDKGGAGSPLALYPAALCSQSPTPSQDSDVEMGCSALLALREADTQVNMEVDVQRWGDCRPDPVDQAAYVYAYGAGMVLAAPLMIMTR